MGKGIIRKSIYEVKLKNESNQYVVKKIIAQRDEPPQGGAKFLLNDITKMVCYPDGSCHSYIFFDGGIIDEERKKSQYGNPETRTRRVLHYLLPRIKQQAHSGKGAQFLSNVR